VNRRKFEGLLGEGEKAPLMATVKGKRRGGRSYLRVLHEKGAPKAYRREKKALGKMTTYGRNLRSH